MQAAGAPEAVISGEVVEAAGDELQGGDLWWFEDCGVVVDVSWPLLVVAKSWNVGEGCPSWDLHDRMWSRISPGRSERPAMAGGGGVVLLCAQLR